MMADVLVKIEPQDASEDDEEQPQDLTTSGPSFNNFVSIKPEPLEEHIKTDFENQSSEDEFPLSTQIKIEPCSGSETDEDDEDRPLRPKARKRKESSDEEYTLASYKKKINKKKGDASNIKPSVRGKSRAGPEMIYKDEIISKIVIETITEEERRVEHQEVLASRRHMRFLCEWCGVGFVIEDAYQVHMKLHTSENGTHECEMCHMWVRNADVLYRHRLRHYRRYRCVVCGLRLRDKDTAAAHIMSDHQGTSFPCPHCDKGFKRPQYLKRHIAQMHTRATEYKCPVCGRVFYERGWYRCHVRSHNEEVQMSASQPLPCAQCGRVFRQRSNLKRHMLTHVREPVTCPHCDVTCDNPELLRVHCVKLHPELVGDVDATCEHCGRACVTTTMLHRHLRRMHADRTKRFECAHCSRRYLTKGEVRSHIMWSHLRRLGGHACHCGRVFRSPARLRHHQRKHHLCVSEPRDKHCPICDKAFANQQVLTRHIRGHSGTTYPCHECGQTFKTQSYVKVHYKIKHLNMTRAQVKAESRRKLLMVDNLDDLSTLRLQPPQTPEVPATQALGQPPIYFADVGNIKEEVNDIEVPKFETFINIQRYLTTGSRMSDLHLSYRLGLSTIKYIIEEVCSLIWKIFKNECLPEPDQNYWNNIALGFERDANFPNCIGALDGKHTRITCPTGSGSAFFNHKQFYSIILLAMCDANYCFTYVNVGACGSEADANVFHKSSLFHRLERNDLSVPPPKLLPGTLINQQPHVIVADAAFGISNKILRPYARTNLTHKKKIFNYRLSRARRYIESSFGILTNKFAIFQRPINVSTSFAQILIKACCILHNFIRVRDGYKEEDAMLIVGLTDYNPGINCSTRSGNTIRDQFANYFVSNEGSVPWQNNYIH